MNSEELIIRELRDVMCVHDKRGRVLDMKRRHCSVVIVTLSGCVRFTQNDTSYLSDGTHPVFIPEGASYKNECIEDADSLMFSFHTTREYGNIELLSPIPTSECEWYYTMIKEAEITKDTGYKQKQLSLIYAMLGEMLSSRKNKDDMPTRAARLIRQNYGSADFNCKRLAAQLFVSEGYLRREFKRKYKKSISEYLRKTRMEKARELLLEKRSVSETALGCGYSEVYQFSRAFKSYYGQSPSSLSKEE